MKKQIVFLILILTTVVVVSGCNKNQQPQGNQAVNNQVQNQQTQQNQTEKKEWQGEVNEADGWKKYVNDYYGIEFKFKDEEDIYSLEDSSGGIVIIGPDAHQNYIDFNNFNNTEYNDLQSYLNNRWHDFDQPAELKYIKNIKNENNISFYKVEAYAQNVQGKNSSYIYIAYYSDYTKRNDISYIKFRCNINSLCEEIVNSFNYTD